MGFPVSGTCIGYLVMIDILISELKEESAANKMLVILLRKTLSKKNQNFGVIVYLLRREPGSLGFSWCLIRRVSPSTTNIRKNNQGMKEN